MENLDIILLTLSVVVCFAIFIVTSLKEISRMKEEPYKFEKVYGFTKAALFNMLSSLFEEEKFSKKRNKKNNKIIERSISDMEKDGVNFKKSAKKGSKIEQSKKKTGTSEN